MKLKALIAAAGLLASAPSFAYIYLGNHNSTPSNAEFILSVFDSAGKTYSLDLGLSIASFADGTNSYSWTVNSDMFAGFLASNSGNVKWAVTGNDNNGTNTIADNLSYYSTLTAGQSTTFAFTNMKVVSASGVSTNWGDRVNNVPGSTHIALGGLGNGEGVAAGGTNASFITTGMYKFGNNAPVGITSGNAIGATDVQFMRLSNSSGAALGAANRIVYTGKWAFDGTTLSYTAATTPAVPEPGTYALLIAGLAAVGFVARRRAA